MLINRLIIYLKLAKKQFIYRINLLYFLTMKLYTEQVVKKYKKRTVVKGVSIEVNQGEIVGLLGPNGAGDRKSVV